MTTEAVIQEYSKRLDNSYMPPYNLFQLKQELLKLGYPLKKTRVIMRHIISRKRQTLRRTSNMVFAGNIITLVGALMVGFPTDSTALTYTSWAVLGVGAVMSVVAVIRFINMVNRQIYKQNIYEF